MRWSVPGALDRPRSSPSRFDTECTHLDGACMPHRSQLNKWVAVLDLAHTENLTSTPNLPPSASGFSSHLGIQIFLQRTQLLQHLVDALIPPELRRRGCEAKHSRPLVRRSWDKGCARKSNEVPCACKSKLEYRIHSPHEWGSPLLSGKTRTIILKFKANPPSKPLLSRVW